MDLAHGLLFAFIGCSITFIGFFIAFLVINYNQRKELKKKNQPKNALYDLNKDMPGSKIGDDCQ